MGTPFYGHYIHNINTTYGFWRKKKKKIVLYENVLKSQSLDIDSQVNVWMYIFSIMIVTRNQKFFTFFPPAQGRIYGEGGEGAAAGFPKIWEKINFFFQTPS